MGNKRTAEIRHVVLAAFVLVGIVLLQSCDTGGSVVLHNASGEAVLIEIFDQRYQIDEEQTVEVRIDPLFGGKDQFTIRTEQRLFCYEMVKVDPNWIRSGFFHAKVLGVLSADWKIYIYPPDSDRQTFFNGPPPVQPAQFPLGPSETSACSRKLGVAVSGLAVI